MTLREITIGRSKDCDIFLDARCQFASNYHATIYYDGTQLMYKDTSSNGTMINNVSVKHRAVPIRHGDNIMVAGLYPINWNQIDAFFPSTPLPQSATMVIPEPPMPQEPDTSSWSWGAFALFPVWGFFNGCWWAFLAMFVYITIIPSICFGIYGRRLAWENRRWSSVQDFEETQAAWDLWGFIAFIVGLFFLAVAIY